MSAPVLYEVNVVKQRFGIVKIWGLLFCYVTFILGICHDMEFYSVCAILGICCAAFLLFIRLLQLWQLRHESVDIFKYEAHFHGLMAIGFMIAFIICVITGNWYYRTIFPYTLLLASIGLMLLAIEACLSARVQLPQPNAAFDISMQKNLQVS